MSKKFAIAREEIRERLREQLGFMARSAAAYDAGDEAEARRLATAIRMLVNHEGKNQALLVQLGMRENLRFLDTCGPIVGNNLGTDNPMVLIQQRGQQRPTYVPCLGDGPPRGPHRKLHFSEWWKMTVIRADGGKVSFSRRELVTTMANQDGGAHVDPTIDEKYARLTRLNEFGWITSNGQEELPLRAIELAHVRQITYELLITLTTAEGLKIGPTP
jgi:hypothetical protein